MVCVHVILLGQAEIPILCRAYAYPVIRGMSGSFWIRVLGWLLVIVNCNADAPGSGFNLCASQVSSQGYIPGL
jgi:hypothetical protein